jgi:ferredoxin
LVTIMNDVTLRRAQCDSGEKGQIMLKASVDKDLCIGCGSCISACPDCFEFGEGGKSHFKEGSDGTKCDLHAVADACPVMAISVEEV